MSENKENKASTEETPVTEQNTEQTVHAENQSEETAAASEPALSEEEQLKKNLEELNDKYLRLYSEFDNYKRRNIKERSELIQSAGKEVIEAMLPVLDDFERAVKAMDQAADVQAVKEGVVLIQNKLNTILTQRGLKPMESVGQDFDVDFHEAITKIPAPSEDLKGKVVDEVEKGYLLKDKVLRFAKVVIGE
ncbi:MAG: nucleotide exchange factor GrpE [Bacteroidetes bacterium]|nr:MAG: nucleotide exchange factor GrpE [Bacteroidota bacterium]